MVPFCAQSSDFRTTVPKSHHIELSSFLMLMLPGEILATCFIDLFVHAMLTQDATQNFAQPWSHATHANRCLARSLRCGKRGVHAWDKKGRSTGTDQTSWQPNTKATIPSWWHSREQVVGVSAAALAASVLGNMPSSLGFLGPEDPELKKSS